MPDMTPSSAVGQHQGKPVTSPSDLGVQVLSSASSSFRQAQTPKGFRDLGPSTAIARSRLIGGAERIASSFGYEPIQTPHLEYASILCPQAGDEVEKQIFAFRDKGGRELALRFDHTVPLARFVTEHRANISMPFRRYCHGSVFRGEQPQDGRYREFTQFDVDCVGSSSLLADVEIVQVLYHALRAGGVDEFRMYINHRKVLDGVLSSSGIGNRAVEALRVLDKVDKIGKDKVLAQLEREFSLDSGGVSMISELIASTESGGDPLSQLVAIEDKFNVPQVQAGAADLRFIINGLRAANVPAEFIALDLSIARGLEYYTGMVFETLVTGGNKLGSVCSGGRYDNLTGSFGSEDLPAVGGSIGVDRLLVALERLDRIPERAPSCQVLIANIEDGDTTFSIALAAGLRSLGVDVSLYLEPIRLGKQLKYADRKGIPFAIIRGSKEIESGAFKLRNMKTGQQISCSSASDVAEVLLSPSTDRN